MANGQPPRYFLLRSALWQLSLEPAEQREVLHGMAVQDELALDLGHAMETLRTAEDDAGIGLPSEVVAAAARLNEMLDVGRGDDLWTNEALASHPVWAEARRIASETLPLIPR